MLSRRARWINFQLLGWWLEPPACRVWGTVVADPGVAGDGPVEEGAAAAKPPMGPDLDKPVFVRENVRLGLFQTQILECSVKPLIRESTHVMVMPLRAGET